MKALIFFSNLFVMLTSLFQRWKTNKQTESLVPVPNISTNGGRTSDVQNTKKHALSVEKRDPYFSRGKKKK